MLLSDKPPADLKVFFSLLVKAIDTICEDFFSHIWSFFFDIRGRGDALFSSLQ